MGLASSTCVSTITHKQRCLHLAFVAVSFHHFFSNPAFKEPWFLKSPRSFHKELTNVNIVSITALHLSQNPWCKNTQLEVEVSLTLTASCDWKNRSHEVVQSSCASFLFCESTEELTVLPFPPKRYTPDMSWNNQHIDMDSNSKREQNYTKIQFKYVSAKCF